MYQYLLVPSPMFAVFFALQFFTLYKPLLTETVDNRQKKKTDIYKEI